MKLPLSAILVLLGCALGCAQISSAAGLADWHARFDEAGADAPKLALLADELLEKVVADERGVNRDTPDLWRLQQWAELLSRADHNEVKRWAVALRQADSVLRVSDVTGSGGGPPLAERLSPASRAALVRDGRFLEEFFFALSPLDNAADVLPIVDQLEREAVGWRKSYLGLGLAVSVVLDSRAAPDWWPHGQVSVQLLPRKLDPPLEAFASLRDLNERNRTLLDLRRQDASDLRFLVASPLPKEDREWAVRERKLPLARLGDHYGEIKYDNARLERGEYVWPWPDYRLSSILERGGICVDQAFFGSEVAKAFGVPAVVFSGQGADARHAWFGYLQGNAGWKMDIGRGQDGRLVSGMALDPQGWTRLTEHEVAFLAERFRTQPRFREARRLAGIAAALNERGRLEEAERFARRAVLIERRLESGWNLLLDLAMQQGAKKVSQVAIEATQAFSRYPDLELRYAIILTEAWSRLGQHSLVEAEELRMLRRHQADRPDISLSLARSMLDRSLRRDPSDRGQKTYERILILFGAKGGIGLFDAVVSPQHQRHLNAGDLRQAKRTVELARRHLRPEKGSQLDKELAELEGPGR